MARRRVIDSAQGGGPEFLTSEEKAGLDARLMCCRTGEMHTFMVVKERHGWSVRLGRGMTTPFWTQAAALREACKLCEELNAHGVVTEVIIETSGSPNEPLTGPVAAEFPETSPNRPSRV